MFCDLGGYTSWTEEDEPEEVAEVLDHFKRRSIDIVEAHGGLVNQFVGDEVLGLFGVPTGHEDDPCRAVAAALALHAFVRSLQAFRPSGEVRRLRLHTGIETGVIYARMRDPRAGLYDVTGDAVNTAARLRSLADVDEVIVGPSTQPRVAPLFELEQHAVARVRGKTQPVAMYRVLGPIRNSSLFEAARARGLTDYVGRIEETRWLSSVWDEVCGGRGQLVSLSGAPGIGKTRLLHEFRLYVVKSERSEEPMVLHGRCLAYGDVAPYQPFIAALRDWLGRSADSHDATLAQLAALGPEIQPSLPVLAQLVASGDARSLLPRATGEQLRDAIVEALAQLLLISARTRPVLLVLEDWHWADEASRDALRVIAPRLAEQRVLILVNYRPSEILAASLPPSERQLALEPLGAAETDSIARAVLQVRELPRGLREFIFERSLGNPFFVEEVCRSLLGEGVLVTEHDRVGLSSRLQGLNTPATIQAIVRARIDRLGPRQRQALRLASVIGSEFSVELVETLMRAEHERRIESSDRHHSTPPAPLDPSELSQVLGELESLGLVYLNQSEPQTAYQFKHAITQEVSYATIPIDQRRAHHGCLAEALELALDPHGRESRFEILAHHYGLSSDRDKAVEYMLLAADKAWSAFSPRQAERQYQRAVGLVDSARSLTVEQKRLRIDVSLSWVRVGLYNPSLEQADALRASFALANEIDYTRGACLCLNWLGWVEQTLGNLSQAVEYSQGFLDSARALEDPALVSQALTNLALNYSFAGDYAHAVDCMERGLALRTRHDGAAFRYAQGQFAMIVADRGDFARARELMDQALESVTKIGMVTMQAPLLVQRAIIAAWRGEFDSCIESAHRAYELARRIEAQFIQGVSLFLQGYGVFMGQRDPQGIDSMHKAIELLDQSGMRLLLSFCLSQLAECLLLLGDLEGAQQNAERALARAAFGDQFGEIAAYRVCAVVASRSGESARAAQDLKRALALCELRSAPRELALTQYRAAEIMAEASPEEASTMLERARNRFSELGMAGYTVSLAASPRQVERDLEL